MAYLEEKFTFDDIEDITSRIYKIYCQSTHWETISNARLCDLQLLNVVDNLCRVSGMLCNVIEQQLEGHIETPDPKEYIKGKLISAEKEIKNFVNTKKIY